MTNSNEVTDGWLANMEENVSISSDADEDQWTEATLETRI